MLTNHRITGLKGNPLLSLGAHITHPRHPSTTPPPNALSVSPCLSPPLFRPLSSSVSLPCALKDAEPKMHHIKFRRNTQSWRYAASRPVKQTECGGRTLNNMRVRFRRAAVTRRFVVTRCRISKVSFYTLQSARRKNKHDKLQQGVCTILELTILPLRLSSVDLSTPHSHV